VSGNKLSTGWRCAQEGHMKFSNAGGTM